MEGKKSFVLYCDWWDWLECLTQEQKAKWVDWLFAYVRDLQPEMPKDQALMMACKYTKSQLKEDLVKYEDFLLPELRDILNRFRSYLIEIQLRGEQDAQPTEHQLEACDKWHDFEQSKYDNQKNMEAKKGEPEKVLKLENKPNGGSGFISTLQVVLFIVGITAIITGIVILLLI